VLRGFPAALFNLLLPDECRICGIRLQNISRVPVCPDCLKRPEPFVAEYFCSVCRTPFLNSSPLDENGRCALCRLGFTGYDAALSFGEYSGTLRSLVHLYKYGKVAPLAAPLGQMLMRALPAGTEFDGIVPLPLHWRRRWRRGFNQSELLARVVSRQTGRPVWKIVRRRKATPPQAGLTSAERRTNVAGAFEVTNGRHIEGRDILLIDDVLTTGATARACAAVLKRSGASKVTVLTLARVDRRRGFSGKSIS
jgi:ComF family protein